MYPIHYDAAARTLHIVTEGFWSPAVFITEVRARGTALPIAAVVASNLAKLQTERYLVGANCRTFLDLAAAKRWLAAAWACPSPRTCSGVHRSAKSKA